MIKVVLDTNIYVSAFGFDGMADYLVTGDKQHLLPIKEFRGIRILTANDFLKLMA